MNKGTGGISPSEVVEMDMNEGDRISSPAGVIETDVRGEAGEMSPSAGALETDANKEDTPPTVVSERDTNEGGQEGHIPSCWRH